MLCTSTPEWKAEGCGNLLKHITPFQEHFPGHRFRVNWFRQQHGQMLAEWTHVGEDGREILKAHSYGRLNKLNVIAHLAGFRSPGAA
jgi:hypothetical protein